MVQFYEWLIVERCYFPDFLITRNLPVASHRPSANVTCLKVKVGKVLAGKSSFGSRKPKTGRPVKPGLEPGLKTRNPFKQNTAKTLQTTKGQRAPQNKHGVCGFVGRGGRGSMLRDARVRVLVERGAYNFTTGHWSARRQCHCNTKPFPHIHREKQKAQEKQRAKKPELVPFCFNHKPLGFGVAPRHMSKEYGKVLDGLHG